MSSLANEDLDALRQGARRFLATHASSRAVRAAMATERGWDPAVWSLMARELGWAALGIPQEHGGAGAGLEAMVALFEETGRRLACAPPFATACLGASAIALCGDDAQRGALLPAIAADGETATL